MKLLVTGGSGLMGKHYSRYIRQTGQYLVHHIKSWI